MTRAFVFLTYFVLTLSIHLGCALLLHLSQFGQNPFSQLPLAVILFFGMLFVAPMLATRQRLEWRSRVIAGVLALMAALTLNTLLLGSAVGTSFYILAPVTAIVLSELYPLMFGRRAALFAAMTVYIVCTLLANYTFDSFLPLPVYGLVNVGTLFFGITFTQRDRVHRYGRRYAYLMIGIAALANVVTALSLGTPLRYVLVGFTAIILSETADTEVYQRFIKRGWWFRVASSNAVSIPIDTLVFTLLAFAGESFATASWLLEVIITDIVVKLVVGLLAAVGVVRAGRSREVLASS